MPPLVALSWPVASVESAQPTGWHGWSLVDETPASWAVTPEIKQSLVLWKSTFSLSRAPSPAPCRKGGWRRWRGDRRDAENGVRACSPWITLTPFHAEVAAVGNSQAPALSLVPFSAGGWRRLSKVGAKPVARTK